MITTIFSGDRFYILERYRLTPTLYELWEEFNSYVPTKGRSEYLKSRLRELAPDESPKGEFLLTRVFIQWLIHGKGFFYRECEALETE